MKPFAAKFNGVCVKCRSDIKVGQPIQGPSAWVHVSCTAKLIARDEDRVTRWREALKAAGFVMEDGNVNVWTRDKAVTYLRFNEHYIVEFQVAYDEHDETVVPEFSFSSYDPHAVVTICDAIRDARAGTPVDDFEAYRQKLLEKLS